MPRAPGDQTGCEERRQHHQPEERRSHSSDRRSDVLVRPRQGVEDRGRPGQAEPGGLVPNPSGGVRGGARNLQVEPQDRERHTPGEGCQDEPARLHAEQRGGGGERAESRRAHALKSQQKSRGNGARMRGPPLLPPRPGEPSGGTRCLRASPPRAPARSRAAPLLPAGARRAPLVSAGRAGRRPRLAELPPAKPPPPARPWPARSGVPEPPSQAESRPGDDRRANQPPPLAAPPAPPRPGPSVARIAPPPPSWPCGGRPRATLRLP